MDQDALYKLLLLEEKLRGHPHLAASKALVDQALIESNAADENAAKKMAFDRQSRLAAEAATKAKAEAEAKREALASPQPTPSPFVKRDVVGGLPGPAERG